MFFQSHSNETEPRPGKTGLIRAMDSSSPWILDAVNSLYAARATSCTWLSLRHIYLEIFCLMNVTVVSPFISRLHTTPNIVNSLRSALNTCPTFLLACVLEGERIAGDTTKGQKMCYSNIALRPSHLSNTSLWSVSR